jgi:2-C-methyl-D-erythritol 4-phosphate cytidylyltransferase
LGIVPVSGRGSLPFALVHGESLVATASFALERAGVQLVDFNVPWAELVETGRPVVLHDPLCPLTPPDFLAAAVEAAAGGEVVAGCRPVTDTLKELADGLVGRTVDRDAHVTVTSPVVLPAQVVATMAAAPETTDFAALVARLREGAVVRLLPAPPLGRRVAQESDLAVLEALSETAASEPA